MASTPPAIIYSRWPNENNIIGTKFPVEKILLLKQNKYKETIERRLYLMTPCTLKKNQSQLVIIDVQERLLPSISGDKSIVRHIKLLLKSAQLLSIPIKYTEQYPKGLGRTVSEISCFFTSETPRFEKVHFSCCDEPGFIEFLGKERRQIVLAGIETHICVLATALDLLQEGFRVAVAFEASGSRREQHHLAALKTLSQCGALVLPTESIVYQWLGVSGTPEFKELLPYFKEQ